MKKRLKIEYMMITSPAENECNTGADLISTDELRVGSAGVKQAQENICGDSACVCKLPSGKKAFILSDGMGKGEVAGHKSNEVVGMLRKLLKQGLSPVKSIRIVNRRLVDEADSENACKASAAGEKNKKSRENSYESSHEIFATIDLLVINEATGRANFYKMGAAKSYIVRPVKNKIGSERNHNLASKDLEAQRKIRVIESEALPVGIISRLIFKRTTVMLKPGDFVVMVSDGVTEADRSDLECRWLKEYLIENLSTYSDFAEKSGPQLTLMKDEPKKMGLKKSKSHRNLQDIATDILSMAKSKQKGLKQDDMSIILLKV